MFRVWPKKGLNTHENFACFQGDFSEDNMLTIFKKQTTGSILTEYYKACLM